MMKVCVKRYSELTKDELYALSPSGCIFYSDGIADRHCRQNNFHSCAFLHLSKPRRRKMYDDYIRFPLICKKNHRQTKHPIRALSGRPKGKAFIR